jgi:hypothetical protein
MMVSDSPLSSLPSLERLAVSQFPDRELRLEHLDPFLQSLATLERSSHEVGGGGLMRYVAEEGGG